MYSILEAPNESVLLVLVNNFIARDRATASPILLLDVGISRDGFHMSGLPPWGAESYEPLIGLPHRLPPNRYPNWLPSVLVDREHLSLHWCEHPCTYAQSRSMDEHHCIICYQGRFRRDGLASVGSAEPHQLGVWWSHPLWLEYRSGATAVLHVNVECSHSGILTASILSDMSVSKSKPLVGANSTDVAIEWPAAGVFSATGVFQLRFGLQDCRMFSFWVDWQ